MILGFWPEGLGGFLEMKERSRFWETYQRALVYGQARM